MAAAGGGASMGMAPQKVRFDAIGDAWKLFQQNMSTWIMAAAAYLVLVALWYVGFIVLMIATAKLGFLTFLLMPVMVIVLMVAMAFLITGWFNLALKQVRGEPISIGSMFNGLPKSAVLTAVVTYFLIAIGSIALIIGSYVVGGLLLFAVPLAIDRGLAPMEAIKLSYETLKGEMLMATLFYLVVGLVAGIGGILCGVGVVITLPLLPLSVMVLYRDFFMTGASNEAGMTTNSYPGV